MADDRNALSAYDRSPAVRSANRAGSTLGYLFFGTLSDVLGYRSVFIVCAILCAAPRIAWHVISGPLRRRWTTR